MGNKNQNQEYKKGKSVFLENMIADIYNTCGIINKKCTE